MYAYNLFQSTKLDGLVCAVPEERTVPPFVVEHGRRALQRFLSFRQLSEKPAEPVGS
jgi:hypothetical protein